MGDKMDARDIQRSITQLQVIEGIIVKAGAQNDAKEVLSTIYQIGILKDKMNGIYEKHKHEISDGIDDPAEKASVEQILDSYMESYRRTCILTMAHDIISQMGKELFPCPFEDTIAEIEKNLSSLVKTTRDETTKQYRTLLSKFPAPEPMKKADK